MKLSHKFVENIPQQLEDGILYISIDYTTAIHKCCCGCRNEVVTPLSPTDWKLTFDGETTSLYPSIGNWSLPCQSHYWITNDEVEWAPKWNRERIERARVEEARNREGHYEKKKRSPLLDFFLK